MGVTVTPNRMTRTMMKLAYEVAMWHICDNDECGDTARALRSVLLEMWPDIKEIYEASQT